MNMENIWEYKRYVPFIGILYCQSLVWGVAGEYCSKVDGGGTQYIQCDYGCCGSSTDRSCCTISTSVLVVACVISGLVVIALVAAIVVCCYKKYRDKRDSRIRQLRQEQADQQVLRRVVQPPKPPGYMNAPPAYSVNMPESHYRPVTVTGRRTPSNQRYDGRRHQFTHQGNSVPRGHTTSVAQGSEQFSRHFVAVTHASGTAMPSGNSLQTVNAVAGPGPDLPGSTVAEPPPPYTEFIRGQTPAHRTNAVNTQQCIREESEVPSYTANAEARTDARTGTQTQQRSDPRTSSGTAQSEILRLQVPSQTPRNGQRILGQSGRGTRVNLHGVQRPQTDESGLETLTIV